MASEVDLDPVLARLVRRPLAIDVVAVLAQESLTFVDLRARLRARRSVLDSALRLLAAHELVCRPGYPGSWDGRAPRPEPYALTGAGLHVVRQLDRFEVWAAIYERVLYGSDGSANESGRW